MKNFFLTFLLMTCVAPLSVFAQEDEVAIGEPTENGWVGAEASTGDVNCFDYYTFQSANVSVSPDKDLYQPGEKIQFSGTIENDNSYPIFDGNLYVRISKYNENFQQEGHYIIDEFFALENIVLDKNSSQDVTFEWDVPVEISKGNYHVDYFFSVGKKFNLGGLPFSNEVVAGLSQFEVDSTVAGYFSFERNKTTINGEKYNQIGDWPIVEKDSEVVIAHTLTNTMGYDVNASVTFDLYFWDSLSQEDKITTEKIFVTVPNGDSKEVTYTVPQAMESVYYLKTTAQNGSSVSVINTRFVVDGVGHARLNYPSITQFPIKKGDNFTLFSCFHNTTYASTEGSVRVRISDEDGNEVAQEEYEGNISSAMSAIKKDIKADKDYEYLTLHAEVKDVEGNIIDVYETEYSCEKLGSCAENTMMSHVMPQNPLVRTIAYVIIVLISVLVFVVFIKIVKNKKNIVGLFMIAFMTMLFFANAHISDAMTTSVNSSKSYTHGAKRASDDNNTIFNYNVASGTVNLNNSITGNNSTVCEGSVTYTYNPTLTFSASGGSWDTPYGAICNGLNCFSSSQSQSITDAARSLPGTIKWISKKPTVTLSSSNNAIMSCSGLVCTAQPGKSGTVTITANFTGVSSQIYSSIKMRPCHRLGTSCSCGSSRYDFTYSPSNDPYAVTSGCIRSDYHSRMYYDGSWHNGTNRMSLNAKSVSWNVTVGSCAQDGACNPAATKNDYAYTATGPNTPLCSAGTAPTTTPLFPDGKYGIDSEVTWTCSGTGGSTVSPVCRAQREAPPVCACSPSTNAQTFSYLTSAWPGAFCAEGSVVGTTPIFPLTGNSVTWQCGGPTCSGNVANCAASHASPAPCECGSAHATTSISVPSANLCNNGDASSVTGNDTWNWSCGTANISKDGFGGYCTDAQSCNARCVDVSIDAPSQFYLTEDGQDVEARVKIDGITHVDVDASSCTINGTSVAVNASGYSDSITLSLTAPATVTASCDLSVKCGSGGSYVSDTYTANPKSIVGMCANRSCTSQSTCQTVPVAASSASECNSTCSSDADCSQGRMIETRP